ncbi:deaminase [Methanospirillum hungatei]|uniref:deaminase n=1 Tax=Methanospirillum hungatei TaxID=2203 RepID=UPI0026EFA003|nr:deaminase [Methanospirillum hungatei]MCA1916316.1 cupin domain-containing protein [Methanospirillum hungatei]
MLSPHISCMDIYDVRIPHMRVADNCLLAELFHPLRIGKDIQCRYSIAHAQVPVGVTTLPHRLIRSSEVYYILSGTGIMHIGDEQMEIGEGQLAYIPPGKTQWIENTGMRDLIFLAICDPLWREEDEVVGETLPTAPVLDDPFMEAAIQEAEKGREEGGIPIGSVLVRDGVIIGRGHNRRVQNNDPMVHAEIDCLQNAGRIGSYQDCTLYSTLMPCFLCAGAVVQFHIPRVIVGESRTFSGAREFMEAHGVTVIDYDLNRCRLMMESFIRENPELWNEDIGVV